MKRLLLAFILLAMTVSVNAIETQSYRSGAILSGTDGSCKFYKPGDSTWMFQRFTYLMAYADCPECIGKWRTWNPNCRIVFYTSGTDMSPSKSSGLGSYAGLGKSTYVRNRMVALGDIEENAYMHFYNDTKITNWNYTTSAWDTVTILGTGSMTIAAKDSVSRVINWYTTYLFTSRNTYTYPTRLAPNFTNAKMRLAYKEYITFAFTSARITYWPAITGYWDGMFFDNYNSSGMQGSHLASGGLVVESGTAPGNLLTYASVAYGTWTWNLMKAFGLEVRDTLKTSATWSADNKHKVLAYNAGLGWNTAFLDPDSSGADAVTWEYGFNPVNSPNNSIWKLENIYAHDSVATLNGATYFWISYARTDYATKQQSIYNDLCFYYIARTDSTWMAIYPSPGVAYGAFYNTGFDTLSWIPAMWYEIGMPTAHYVLDTTGVSPDLGTGHVYKVWSREYQEGKVYSRPRDNLDHNVWGSISTPITVDLHGEYRKLNPDGTLGFVITTLPLLGAEGAILIPVSSGTCSEPPSIPVLSSPADSATVTSRTPTLCVVNSTQPDTCLHAIVYCFQVSASSDFLTIVSEQSYIAQGTTTTCWTVTVTLNPAQLYYWRCRANNGTSASNWSDWSASHRFITPGSGLTAPSLLTPVDDSAGISVTPTLTVTNNDDVEGVTSYRFEVATDSLFVWIVADSVVAKGTTTTSWIVSPALQHNTTYYWRVFAWNGYIYSNSSTVRTFTTYAGMELLAIPSSLNIAQNFNYYNPCDLVDTIFITSLVDSTWSLGVDYNYSTWIADFFCLGYCSTPAMIRIGISCSGLGVGVYRDTITVTTSQATNSPLKIPVTLTITNPSTGTRLMLRK